MPSKKVSGAPKPDGSTPAGDWREVTEALDALGESITRAMRCAVENDEYRRRIRELRDGLAYLAIRIGEPSAAAAPQPAAWTAPPAQPPGLDAFRVANEKFRQGAGAWDGPATPGQTAPISVEGTPSWALPAAAAGAAAGGAALGAAPSAVPVPAPAVGGASVWATPAAQPAPSVWAASATPATPSVQAAAAAYVSPFATPAAVPAASVAPAVPATPPAPEDLLNAVRVANERFQAERAAATAAAAAAMPEPAPVTQETSWLGEADEAEVDPFAERGEAPYGEIGEGPGEDEIAAEPPVEEPRAQLFEEEGEDGPGDTPPPSPPSDFTP
jgi:hypothetical protein